MGVLGAEPQQDIFTLKNSSHRYGLVGSPRQQRSIGAGPHTAIFCVKYKYQCAGKTCGERDQAPVAPLDIPRLKYCLCWGTAFVSLKHSPFFEASRTSCFTVARGPLSDRFGLSVLYQLSRLDALRQTMGSNAKWQFAPTNAQCTKPSRRYAAATTTLERLCATSCVFPCCCLEAVSLIEQPSRTFIRQRFYRVAHFSPRPLDWSKRRAAPQDHGHRTLRLVIFDSSFSFRILSQIRSERLNGFGVSVVEC